MTDLSPNYDIAHLAAREEIRDVIYLYCHATDRRQWHLMERVFHADALYPHTSNTTWQEIIAFSKAALVSVEVTQHVIGNILISIDGDTAHTESYCTAYHKVRGDAGADGLFPGTGEGREDIVGIRYVDRFERRDGIWRIAERRGITDYWHVRCVAEGSLDQIPLAGRGVHGPGDLGAVAAGAWS